MRVKRVNRYYCDYCKKTNCSASSISRHEKHCTLNPNRICGMCEFIIKSETCGYIKSDHKQVLLKKLLKVLPTPESFKKDEYGFPIWDSAIINKALVKLRKITTCPACIMAALRQRGIPVYVATDFNYKEEVAAIFEKDKEENDRY